MLFSMTGFSSQNVTLQIKEDEKVSLAIEIKTLNSRFFEVSCKFPGGLGFLEVPVINILKQKLVRGRVFVSIWLSGHGGVFETVIPVLKVVKEYCDAAQKIKKELSVSGELTISDVVMLPNVFSVSREEVGEDIEEAFLGSIEKVADQLICGRKSEGARLQKDLEKRFDLCASHIENVKNIFDLFMKQQKTKAKKLLVLVKKEDQESKKQLEELYEFINKIDIHEEIVRLKSHLNGVKKLFKSKQIEKGRRLDFVLQELARETNTIAAKCSHVDISSFAIDIKVELEKVREQVQNIV